MPSVAEVRNELHYGPSVIYLGLEILFVLRGAAGLRVEGSPLFTGPLTKTFSGMFGLLAEMNSETDSAKF